MLKHSDMQQHCYQMMVIGLAQAPPASARHTRQHASHEQTVDWCCCHLPPQGASGGSDNEGSEDSYALVHGSAGTIEDLPPALQAVAAALQHNQEQIDVAGQRRARERLSAMRAVQEEVQGLFAKRR
jgi:hypothetical protein